MSKFSNYGKKSISGYGQYGTGSPIRPEDYPRDVPRRFSDFSAGYVSADSREDIPEESSPHAPDMEVDRKDRLTRAPGTTLVESYEVPARTPSQMTVHSNLDYKAELLLFDPPYIGIKADSDTVFHDIELNDLAPYVWTHYGEQFVFSNGINKVYYRDPYDAGATESTEIPIARTYASFAGRLWGAHVDIGGTVEPLGIRWAAPTGDIEDWDGIDSGYELLLDDAVAGDRIVALRTMGFDLMAVINRKSIWVGRRTGVSDRPADFTPREAGVGAINEKSVVASRHGIFILSDNGIYLFNGNRADLLSAAINPDLLPIDYSQLDKYHAFYDPFLKRLYQVTPTQTFIFDVERKRWFHRTYRPDAISLFIEQIPEEIWDTDNEAWDLDDAPWDTFSVDDLPDLLMLGTEAAATVLVEEDYNSETAFGVTLTPTWELRLELAETLDQLLTIKGVNLEYEGSGTLRVYVPSSVSQYTLLYEIDLPVAIIPTPVYQPVLHTGRGSGSRIEYVTGDMQISKIELIVMARGKAVGLNKAVPSEYHPEF